MEERNNRLLNAKLNKYIVPGIMMSLALQLGEYCGYDICK